MLPGDFENIVGGLVMAGNFKQVSFDTFGAVCNCDSSVVEDFGIEEEKVVLGATEFSVWKCACG